MMKTLVLHIPEDPSWAEPPRIANPLGEQQALTVVFPAYIKVALFPGNCFSFAKNLLFFVHIRYYVVFYAFPMLCN